MEKRKCDNTIASKNEEIQKVKQKMKKKKKKKKKTRKERKELLKRSLIQSELKYWFIFMSQSSINIKSGFSPALNYKWLHNSLTNKRRLLLTTCIAGLQVHTTTPKIKPEEEMKVKLIPEELKANEEDFLVEEQQTTMRQVDFSQIFTKDF